MEIFTRRLVYVVTIVTVVYLLPTISATCSVCTEDNLKEIVTKCQSSAAKLEQAELQNNKSLVCSRLHELFVCVGEKVPQCLHEFAEQYQKYMYTPWDCHFSEEHLLTYQELANNGCITKSETHTSKTDANSDTNSNDTNSDTNNHPSILLSLVVVSSLIFNNNSYR